MLADVRDSLKSSGFIPYRLQSNIDFFLFFFLHWTLTVSQTNKSEKLKSKLVRPCKRFLLVIQFLQVPERSSSSTHSAAGALQAAYSGVPTPGISKSIWAPLDSSSSSRHSLWPGQKETQSHKPALKQIAPLCSSLLTATHRFWQLGGWVKPAGGRCGRRLRAVRGVWHKLHFHCCRS